MMLWLLVLVVNIFGVLSNPLTSEIVVAGGDESPDLADITQADVLNAATLAQNYVKSENEHDQNLYKVGVKLEPDTAGIGRFGGQKLSQDLIDKNLASGIMSKTLEILSQGRCGSYELSPQKFIKTLQKKKFRLSGICNDTSKPDPQKAKDPLILKYRTLDGSYNNLKHPDWGQAGTAYPRFLEPNYGDGISSPRLSKRGEDLANARFVSIRSFPSRSIEDNELSMAAAEFTQVMSHDISLDTMDSDLDSGPISCCSKNQKCILPDILSHRSCLPVEVYRNDPFYSKYDIRCLNFIRSIATPRSDCLLSWREQLNAVSGYLDASFIYGSSETVSQSIRAFKNGLMLESDGHRLPTCKRNTTDTCFTAGDIRVNQQVHLASTQTIFLREHNRVATILKKLNSNWDDETLYQETRRIVIAEYQNIVYNELLPLLFDNSFYKLIFGKSDSLGFTNNYDENVHGGSYNDFTAAYRALHTMIPNEIKLCDEARKILASRPYSDMLSNVSALATPTGVDDVVRGMTYAHMMYVDNEITQEITNKLFKGGQPYGTDLMMLDIQRAREHGVTGYNDYRKFSGLEKVDFFEDLFTNMEFRKIALLKELYDHPDDIDLIVGGLLERIAPGSKFGIVIQYILQEQFYRSMIGDRFFFTHKTQAYPFTAKQLAEIKKTSYSNLICRNSDITRMPPSAFLVESFSNQRISCNKIEDIDLSFWKQPLRG